MTTTVVNHGSIHINIEKNHNKLSQQKINSSHKKIKSKNRNQF